MCLETPRFVCRKTFGRRTQISEEMAQRIEEVLDIDAQLLLDIQNAHNFWRTKHPRNFYDEKLEP